MYKKISLLISLFVIVSFLATPVFAKGPNGKKGGEKGNSNIGHLYLYEKVPQQDDSEWPIVPGGAWGKMMYIQSGEEFQFVFNGHRLPANGTDFTLIYYADPWEEHQVIYLGDGTTDEDGNIHIMNSVDTGDLPLEGDQNANEDTTTYTWNKKTGAKIWLVLSEDIDTDSGTFVDWDATAYLFEADLINFEDTDD